MTVNPLSLFGKYPYPHEQRMIMGFTKEVDLTVALVSPLTVLSPLPISLIPADLRRRKIKEHLTKAKDILSEMGV